MSPGSPSESIATLTLPFTELAVTGPERAAT
jgi:hypothetical protein